MDIGRRELLTGVAAVAVAGVVPVMPICAAQFTPRMFALNGYWHFDIWPDGAVEIRDDHSTFGFYNFPRADGTPVFDCIAPDDPPHMTEVFGAFARAASFVAKQAWVIGSARGEQCPMRFYYSQRDPRRPFADVIIEASAGPHGIGSFFEFDENFPQVYASLMAANRHARLYSEYPYEFYREYPHERT
jgi:hypothetical protein